MMKIVVGICNAGTEPDDVKFKWYMMKYHNHTLIFCWRFLSTFLFGLNSNIICDLPPQNQLEVTTYQNWAFMCSWYCYCFATQKRISNFQEFSDFAICKSQSMWSRSDAKLVSLNSERKLKSFWFELASEFRWLQLSLKLLDDNCGGHLLVRSLVM